MATNVGSGVATMADFVAGARVPAAARDRAAMAIVDTAGVTLAGVVEPAARMVQRLARDQRGGTCRVLGLGDLASPEAAALANGVAAHALDYDDMCFVSLAHPSCALVPALLAAAELVDAPGRVLPDAYVVGFEVECRLGGIMNPRHYHERGWHCTSTIGTLGAAAGAARVLALDSAAALHALGIAASAACGFKENFGSMVKPLHAGLAARNGLMAARLAQQGFTASPHALDGPQGYLAVMDSGQRTIDDAVADLGGRWEMLETGVTVKLYPSCAATHPPVDALIELRRREAFRPDAIESILIELDTVAQRLLIHDKPVTGLEAKFSMPFCAAAAVVHGRLGIDSFDEEPDGDPEVRRLMPRITLRANPAFDRSPPLSQARVSVHLRDGRVMMQASDGARGYPGKLSDEELAAKFHACATRTLSDEAADRAWTALAGLDGVGSVRELTALLSA